MDTGFSLRTTPEPAQVGPVKPRVDLDQLLVLLDQSPFLEVDFVEVTRDARPDLDGIDRSGPAGEVRVVGDFPLDGIADGDRHRCGRWRNRGRPGATGHADRKGTKGKSSNPHGSPHLRGKIPEPSATAETCVCMYLGKKTQSPAVSWAISGRVAMRRRHDSAGSRAWSRA